MLGEFTPYSSRLMSIEQRDFNDDISQFMVIGNSKQSCEPRGVIINLTEDIAVGAI